ncbi:MAG: endonuclease/exonuclease/phosphatase family protein [Thermoguttaceae bacterium]|nr:endonuclease/exonuclease/phosphatase family protein [Thermoguttaceae bacterium]
MKKLVCFAALAVLSLVATGVFAQEKDKNTLRLVFYNVERGAWAAPDEIAAMLREYDPDVVGFNEVPQGDWTKRVGTALGYDYSYTGRISSAMVSANFKEDWGLDKYKSILSRYPIHDVREILLDAPGGWNQASGVGVTIDVNGKKVAIYSTHLCFNENWDDHAKQLFDGVVKHDVDADLIIVGGDFNCHVDHASGIKHFLDGGFKNNWLELKIDTTDLFTYSAQDPDDNLGVIDQIVFKGDARATDGGIIELEKALSDHKPIWIELKF